MKTKLILIGIALMVIIPLFVFQCNEIKDKERFIDDLIKMKRIKLKFENDVAFKESLLVRTESDRKHYFDMLNESKLLNESLKKELKKYKELNSHVNIQTITTIKKDTIFIKDSIQSFKQFHVKKTTNEFNIQLTVDSRFVSIDSLLIPNKQDIIIGKRKDKWYKQSKYEVSVINSNPNIQTIDINSMQFKPKKLWYQKNYIYFCSGIIAGGILINKLK